jgi:hypothetical protein
MKQLGVKEVMDVIFYDVRTNKPVLFLDTLTVSSLQADASTTDIQGGKGNAKLMSFDHDRKATLSVTDALMNPRTIALQSGVEITTGAEQIDTRDELALVAGKITLRNAPVGAVTLYKKENEFVTELTGSTVAGNQVTITDSSVTAGDMIVAYYEYQVAQAETVSVTSDGFGGVYKVVGLTTVRNRETGVDEAFTIVIPRAKISSAFKVDMQSGGNASTFDFTLDVQKPVDSNEMVKLINIG